MVQPVGQPARVESVLKGTLAFSISPVSLNWTSNWTLIFSFTSAITAVMVTSLPSSSVSRSLRLKTTPFPCFLPTATPVKVALEVIAAS